MARRNASAEEKNAYQRAYYADNKQKVLDRKKRLYARHPERYAEYARRARRNQRSAFRDRGYRDRYGMSLGEYYRMFFEQGGACALCGSQSSKTWLYVDHDHATGAIRGLLCPRCNGSVGHLEFLLNEHLDAAIQYIQRGKKCP